MVIKLAEGRGRFREGGGGTVRLFRPEKNASRAVKNSTLQGWAVVNENE